MTASDRKEIRQAARDTLTAAPYFAGFTAISAWVQSVDVAALPAWAVATPQERRTRDNQTVDQRDLTLALVIKRVGGADIEDALDDDADAAEAVIVSALRTAFRECELAMTETRVDGDGAQRVGTLTMSFTVTYWVDDPA